MGRPAATRTPAARISCQCSERIIVREPRSSAMARQVTPRAAARFKASTTLRAVVVRQPDVEQHMDVIRCGIDIGHHRVDRGVGVRQKARGVATHGMEPADRVAEPKEMPVTLGNGGSEVRRLLSGVIRDRRHALEDRVQPLHAATADVHLAQEKIGEDAHQGEHANDHHPRDSGSRVAMGPKQDPHDDRQLEQRDKCDSEQRVMERCDDA